MQEQLEFLNSPTPLYEKVAYFQDLRITIDDPEPAWLADGWKQRMQNHGMRTLAEMNLRLGHIKINVDAGSVSSPNQNFLRRLQL